MKISIALGENDFNALVQGKIVKKQRGKVDIEITLKDVGFPTLTMAIESAEHTAKLDKIPTTPRRISPEDRKKIKDQIEKAAEDFEKRWDRAAHR